jgi:hypothetical protein
MTPLLQAGLSPGCVTGVGSLPFTDTGEAVEFVAEFSPELPFWPQLPLRDPGEGVIAQGMGSLIEYLEPADQKYCWSVRSGAVAAFAAALERADGRLNPETAAGFFAMESAIQSGRFPGARAAKAQLEGPATLAHCLFLDGVPLARVAGWLDRLAGFLERQAAWQVRRLAALGLPVVFVLDEPAVALVNSKSRAAPALAGALRRVLGAARREGAAVGIHCCAPIPSVAFRGLGLDLLSFDANLPTDGGFVELARAVLDRGGHLAFGLAPTGSSSATVESMEAIWTPLASSLGDLTTIAARSLVTATCGLGLSTLTETVTSFTLAREMGAAIRTRAATPASGGLP